MMKLFFAIIVIFTSRVYAIEVTDDVGNKLSFEKPVHRIISLAPHITELIFSAGAGDRLVGVSEHSDYPPEANTIASVGQIGRFDFERIISLKPELVVVWKSGNGVLTEEKLRRLGIRVFVSEPRTLDDIASSIERFSQIAATIDIGKREVARFNERRSSLVKDYNGKKSVRVFYQIWDHPIITLNGQQIVSRVIELCGGENVFAALPAIAPNISREAVISANPDVIIASGLASERPEWLDRWRDVVSLRAVKSGQLYVIPADLIQRHTVRLLDGAQLMCGFIDKARKQLSR